MFVTLSCSGLPDLASCTFTPSRTSEILSTTPPLAPAARSLGVPASSAMVLLTSAASTTSISPATRPAGAPLPSPGHLCCPALWALAAWPGERGAVCWLSRISVVALVGLVTLLGTTACNPRYNYEHHGPLPNPATPAGTYTVTVTGQYSDGVTATTHNTTFVLTVK